MLNNTNGAPIRADANEPRRRSRTASKAFARLRGELRAHDIDPDYLARLWGLSTCSIGRRLRGEFPWNLDEMYELMEMLNWPVDRMHEMFPRYGRRQA